mgnify:CR=1 FL=1
MKTDFENKKILIMPTERIWLHDKIDETLYFKKWSNLLNNSNLLNFIEDNNIFIYFYPSKQLNEYIDRFKFKSKNIKIVNNVQDLIIDSSLLVTDYSNIYMTFASMLKPVIYYQFDLDEYNKYHKNNLILFGKVLTDEEDVVNRIIGYTNMNYKIEKIYKQKINNFFDLEEL